MSRMRHHSLGIGATQGDNGLFIVDDGGEVQSRLKDLRKRGGREQASAIRALLKARGFEIVGSILVIRGVEMDEVGAVNMHLVTSIKLLDLAIEQASLCANAA